MSAEPGRKKAYGIDLRWRVVYQRIGMNLTYDKIATNLNIAASTAYYIYEVSANRKSRPCTERTKERAEKAKCT